MSKKVSSKNLATRFLAGLDKTKTQDQEKFLEAFVNWLYIKRHWRRRQEIFKAIKKAWYSEQGVVEAIITTSAELTPEVKQDLIKALEKYFNKKIIAEYKIQPSILGGLTVEADGEVLTFTFQQLLNNLMH